MDMQAMLLIYYSTELTNFITTTILPELMAACKTFPLEGILDKLVDHLPKKQGNTSIYIRPNQSSREETFYAWLKIN